MRPRLEPSGLEARGQPPAESGHSAVVAVSGPGIGSARIGIVLHSSGAAYTVAMRADGRRLPPALAGGDLGLDLQPPELPESDRPGREWVAGAVASLTRPADGLQDDHRWWGDVGALIMLADLLED